MNQKQVKRARQQLRNSGFNPDTHKKSLKDMMKIVKKEYYNLKSKGELSSKKKGDR